MSMQRDANLDVAALLIQAKQLGFDLTPEQVVELAKGVRRNQESAERVRGVVSPELEPAPTFHARPKDDR